MSTVAEVKLWGRTIGAVAMADSGTVANFEYDSQFIRSGIEIAPLTMPLANTVYRFPALGWDTFRGLPGLLADSLPDKFGNALIDATLLVRLPLIDARGFRLRIGHSRRQQDRAHRHTDLFHDCLLQVG